VLAIRVFNKFLLDECFAVSNEGGASKIIDMVLKSLKPGDQSSAAPSFVIQEGVKLHMYCSEAPCMFPNCATICDKLNRRQKADDRKVAMQAWSSPWLPKKMHLLGRPQLMILGASR
jgi:hypothetical protein